MKKLRNDILLIGGIVVICIIMIISFYACSVKENLMASVYHKETLVLTIDLNNLIEEEQFIVQGDLDEVIIIANKKGVRISSAGCKDEICINQGTIYMSSQSLVCLPNRIYIRLVGNGLDVSI